MECDPNTNTDYCHYAIIGIGLNLNQKSFPKPLETKDISFYQRTGNIYDKYQFIGLLNIHLDFLFPIHNQNPEHTLNSRHTF